MKRELKQHSPTGYCRHCGYWVGYTPKDECLEYPKEQYSTTEFNKRLKQQND